MEVGEVKHCITGSGISTGKIYQLRKRGQESDGQYTGFPHYPKVECFYEIFCKQKWDKAQQLPLVYMKKDLELSQAPKITSQVFLVLQDSSCYWVHKIR